MKLILIIFVVACVSQAWAWSFHPQDFLVLSQVGEEVGVVNVWQESDDFICFNSSHSMKMWIGSSLAELPINYTGQYTPFIYEMGCFNMTFWMEFDVYQCDAFVYAVFAGEESYVPANISFTKGNTSGVVVLPISCDEEPDEAECVVGMAYTADSKPLSAVKDGYEALGYVNGPITNGPVEFTIVTSEDKKVGTVHLDVNESRVTLSVDVEGWGLEAYQVFLGPTMLPKIPVGDGLMMSASPFHFPYQKNHVYGAQFDTYTISTPTPFYFVAQFILCR